MDIKIMRVAMLCAQRGIRAYTRVENGIQTTALGIELKVILTASSVNLTELDIIKD